MFFVNLTLIEFLGLLAASSAATVALYLLIRARRTVRVPTLRFWQQAQRALEQKRRRRIDQPLSLLLQLLALALLLLAIAQPRLGPGPETGAWHVLLLDGSSWMQVPALEQDAKRQALAWLRALPAQDRVQVVRVDALPTPLTPFTAGREEAARAIRGARASSSALDLAPAFELAQQALRLHAARAGEIVYAGPLYASAGEDLAPPPNLRLLVTPPPPPNAGLTRVMLRRLATDPARVLAQVQARNYGPAPRTAPLLAGFSGSVVASQMMQLPAGGEATATFEFRAAVAGWVEVRLEARDALPADDRATLELPAPPLVRVVVFSDDPAQLRPLLARTARAGAHIATLCATLHRRDGEPGVRRILGVLALAKKYEHGFKHTAVIHSRNVETITRMGRELDTTLYIQNGPSFAGLGTGGDHRSGLERDIPARLLAGVGLGAELEGHPAHDQRGQHQEERQIEAAEQRGVPVREGREHRAAGSQQPHLVRIPHRPDGVDDEAALLILLPDDPQQDADPVVEAFEDKETGEKHADQNEPEGIKFHELPPRESANRQNDETTEHVSCLTV